MPLRRMDLGEFRKLAPGIERPEDVVAHRDGRIFASYHQGAVAELHPGGGFTPMGPANGAPNGLTFDRDGTLLIANFGIFDGAPGPLERFDLETSKRSIVVDAIDGRRLTSCNYAVVAANGDIWCSHSTWAPTWPDALDGRRDGFIFLVRPDGALSIVADGLRFPNGLAISDDDAYLYCTQTSWGDVLRFAIHPDGTLGPPEPYGPKLGFVARRKLNPELTPPAFITSRLGYTDGVALDAEGNLWVTMPAAHKLVAITPWGEKFTVLHDPSGTLLRSPTNVAWGGPTLEDLYIGDLDADFVLTARSPVPGMSTLHQRQLTA